MNYPNRKQLIIGLVLLLAIIFGFGYQAGQTKESSDLQPVITTLDRGTETPKEDTPPAIIAVHVTGAVEHPGVYSFPEGTRVNEGINKAGPLKDAELSYINLAEIMTDQQQIIVPSRDQYLASRSAAVNSAAYSGPLPAAAASSRVNINTAGASVLQKLPGIGPVTAKKIIDFRKENGRFNDINELMKVDGIGEKKFARLKEKIVI